MLEGKDKDYLNILNNNIKKIRHLIYNYLNYFSMKNKDYKEVYLNYKYSFPSDNGTKNIEQNEEEIKKRNEIFCKNFENELSSMNRLLESLKEYIETSSRNNGISKSNQELIRNIDYQQKLFTKIYQNREIGQRSDFLYIIFKAMINSNNDLYVRESVKSERRSNLLLLRNKYIKPQRPINDVERIDSPNEVIKDYITKNYKESNIKINIDIINIPSKIYSKSKLPIPIPKVANINVNIGPLYLLISLPYEREYSHNYRPTLFVNNIYLFEPKSIMSKTVLFRKITNLLEFRFRPMLNFVYEEKRKKQNILFNNPNSPSVKIDKEFLVEFLKKLVNYLYDYDKIFKIKCDFCGKLTKYSLVEKYFFPPYYKMYKEKEMPLSQNNKIIEVEKNYFYHEDCFKKIANPSL
jgi:hypothetical protein